MSRIRTLKKQQPLPRFLAKTTAEAVRKLLNVNSAFTYTQNAEDILAMSLLEWPTSGFYVDVGCNLPEKRSNTFLFYLRGGHGIGIDANGSFAAAWRAARPGDIFVEFVEACIGQGEDVEFHTFEGHALSNIGGERVEGVSEGQYRLVEKRKVTTVPLQTLLERHGIPRTFDMLSVDVEGYDEVVLDTVDLQVYRPRLIIVEAHQPEMLDLAGHPVVRRLGKDDYRLVAVQKSNMFFLRET
ncbi:FkbM family methyltransferase [Mameliella alba]|uniref:Methyltransferase FkbM n=1 Tax=Mameliella alba TaxID=561184 RepID=A0A0B3S0P6_9RHOB|nr:FkbM family methyltransferase [Mameliella alba]KHQ50161.1 Methyltransferase FkbM [Mameliella alba]